MEPIKHLITEFRLLAYGVAPQEFEYAKNILKLQKKNRHLKKKPRAHHFFL